MPLYEYECDACGHRFEVIQKYTDRPVATCPECGGPVHKLLSSPAIQFKGSGWYITDYARKNSAEKGKPESAPNTSDAKPAEAAKSASTEGAAASSPPTPAGSSSKES
jgi:putative FmdB family regulatory protein